MNNLKPDLQSAASNQNSEDDFAAVTINIPFDAAWLRSFIANPQRVLRINSQMEFSDFKLLDKNRWHMTGKNLANGKDFDVTFKAEPFDNGITLSYEGWLKTATKMHIEPDEPGQSKLVITDDYSGVSLNERQQRLVEVDNSIMQWASDIHRYAHSWKRWSWLPGWKPYMLHFWQGMKPSARRIAFMLIALTIGEFIIFLFVLTIFWLELPRLFS